MDPPPKRHMATRDPPAQVHLVGMLEFLFVTVAGGPEQQHRCPGWNVDAAERRVRRHGTHHVAKWGLEPEGLLDEERHLIEVPAEMVLKLGVFGEHAHRVAEQTCGGLSARAQQDGQDAGSLGAVRIPSTMLRATAPSRSSLGSFTASAT